MRKRDIVVIGGSAGAIDAMKVLVGGLPSDFPASVFAVVHSSDTAPGYLAELLSNQGSLRGVKVTSQSPIEAGHLYTSPPGRHLALQNGLVRAVAGPKENRFRPSIDVLFRSAASAHRERVVGVLLSGYLDDGVSGLGAIKEVGGIAIVQAPEDAYASALPENALNQLEIDYCLPVAKIPELLVKLVDENINKQTTAAAGISTMPDSSNETPSRYTCPDCGGTLFEVVEGKVKRFRCRVGHAYSDRSLLSAQDERTENTLWAAQRALEERADMLSRLAERYRDKNNEALVRRYSLRAEASARQALQMRELLESSEL